MKSFSYVLAVACAGVVTVAAAQQTTQPQAPTTQPPTTQTPTMTPPQMPDAASRLTDERRTLMLTLLDWIQKLSAPPDESKAGKVTVDRATLDEIGAEIAQIKAMLQK